ncbi:MAG: preprotein translocase subunit YajC [Actinomycetota bacterium]|nr:preprotein translocase subunit YajC [Actinomycetota bacterium]
MQSPVGSLVFLVLLFVLFYFMLIRPQKRRMEQHRRLVESLGLGDEVVTIGGIFGTVDSMGAEELVLEVAPGTKIRTLKSAIARKVTEEAENEELEEAGDMGEEDDNV